MKSEENDEEGSKFGNSLDSSKLNERRDSTEKSPLLDESPTALKINHSERGTLEDPASESQSIMHDHESFKEGKF